MKVYNEKKDKIIWDTDLYSDYVGYPNEEEWIEKEYGDYYNGETIEEFKKRIINFNNYEEPDLYKGHLKQDTIIIHYPEIQAVEGKGHYETIREYPNGGKDVRWIVEVEPVSYQASRDEEEEILVYVPYTEEEILENKKNELRERREIECFPIINRGKLWYDNLTEYQIEELDKWYRGWLNVTDTLVVPEKPIWLK